MIKELKLLRDKKMGIVQLNSAKKQLKGNIALSQENKVGLASGLAKSFLVFNVDSLSSQDDTLKTLRSEGAFLVSASTTFPLNCMF